MVKSSCGRDLVPQQHPDHNWDGQQRVASSRSVGVQALQIKPCQGRSTLKKRGTDRNEQTSMEEERAFTFISGEFPLGL
jgi:hypothetical protein